MHFGERQALGANISSEGLAFINPSVSVNSAVAQFENGQLCAPGDPLRQAQGRLSSRW
jgi:hypothetical protein